MSPNKTNKLEWIIYFCISKATGGFINNYIDLSIFTPEQFELVVTRSDRNSILVDDQTTLLPDFILPRIGSSMSFYAVLVIRQLEHYGVYFCNSANAIQNVKDKL